jgi:hypothetical protein
MGAILRWTNLQTGESLVVRTVGPEARPAAGAAGGIPGSDEAVRKDDRPLNYWIRQLPVGRYRVRISARGYFPLMVPIVNVAPGAQRIDFGPLEPRPGIQATSAPAAATSGEASGSTEDPLGAGAVQDARELSAGSVGSDGLTPPTYAAQFGYWQLSPPSSVSGNSYFDVVFLMKNAGTATWTWGYGTQRIWVAFKGTGFSTVRVLPLTATVGGNGQLSIRVTLRAPGSPGTYRVQFALTRNGIPFNYWTPSVNVVVR